ncbi:MAG TPA: Xaa-Pro peptidase family protein [Chloroflexota bacterium]|nr:Xaa-Pro peptidase family protein [Chloroflexota bacterium]
MKRGSDRIERVKAALRDANLDALVCTLPENVLLLTGYWPVVGTAIAVAAAGGDVWLLAPEDEHNLALFGWADTVRPYAPGSLTRLTSPAEAAQPPLTTLLREAGLGAARIGYESSSGFEGAGYAAIYLFGDALAGVLRSAAPDADLHPAGASLARLRSALTPAEVDKVRLGCSVAKAAFETAAKTLGVGRAESEVAADLAGRLSVLGLASSGVQRAGGFAYCMSGANSARAGAAYARSTAREPRDGDFILVHCNSYIDGYWTDITRTYVVGGPDERQRSMYEAVFAARHAALSALRPGVRASEVDKAARDVLTDRGFGPNFTHGLGHNVGFSVISTEYPPRLHPASHDLLEVGMTFNLEPAIYIAGFGGLRHCDVVTLGPSGAEVLSPFHARLEELVLAHAVQ